MTLRKLRHAVAHLTALWTLGREEEVVDHLLGLDDAEEFFLLLHAVARPLGDEDARRLLALLRDRAARKEATP